MIWKLTFIQTGITWDSNEDILVWSLCYNLYVFTIIFHYGQVSNKFYFYYIVIFYVNMNMQI